MTCLNAQTPLPGHTWHVWTRGLVRMAFGTLFICSPLGAGCFGGSRVPELAAALPGLPREPLGDGQVTSLCDKSSESCPD